MTQVTQATRLLTQVTLRPAFKLAGCAAKLTLQKKALGQRQSFSCRPGDFRLALRSRFRFCEDPGRPRQVTRRDHSSCFTIQYGRTALVGICTTFSFFDTPQASAC